MTIISNYHVCLHSLAPFLILIENLSLLRNLKFPRPEDGGNIFFYN